MAHIDLPEGLPGILGPMALRPETTEPLNAFTNALLFDENNTLTRGERELIAARVSRLNGCKFCCDSHSTFAALQIAGGFETVDCVLDHPDDAPVSEKMKALLTIAGQVQQSGRAVTEEAVADARAKGATDIEIHDTVLIAAAFCMFNRYVDGLGTWAPENRDDHLESGRMIVQHGYGAPVNDQTGGD